MNQLTFTDMEYSNRKKPNEKDTEDTRQENAEATSLVPLLKGEEKMAITLTKQGDCHFFIYLSGI